MGRKEGEVSRCSLGFWWSDLFVFSIGGRRRGIEGARRSLCGMDCVEEQQQEIEALEAIFTEELVVLEEHDGLRRVQLPIMDEESGASVRVDFSLPKTYPEVAPKVSVHGVNGVSAPKRMELQGILQHEAEENVGTPMIFTLHTAAKEWIEEHISGNAKDGEDAGDEVVFETRDEEEELKMAQKEKQKVSIREPRPPLSSLSSPQIRVSHEAKNLATKRGWKAHAAGLTVTQSRKMERGNSFLKTSQKMWKSGVTSCRWGEELWTERGLRASYPTEGTDKNACMWFLAL